MPYGQGQSIGSTVNPGLFTQDYSGFANAGALQGAMMLGIGQAVGDIGKAIGERKKEQTQKEKEIKMAENIAGMIEQTMPDIAPNVASIRANLGDRNIPLDMRHADAQSIMEVLNIGVMGKRMKMEEEAAALNRMDTMSNINSRNIQSNALSDEISDARRKRETDGRTRSAIGPALLQSVIGMVPPAIGGSLDISQYTPEQQYDLANVLTGMIPKDAAPPEIKEIAVPGGKMQMQWDSSTRSWGPLRTSLQSNATVSPEALPGALGSYADAFNQAGAKYGINPQLLAAISIHETGGGTSKAFTNKNNAMGISNSSGPVDTGTVEASIDRMARLLAAGQRGEGPYAGADTIEKIAKVYAPVGAENDPRGLNKHWTTGVTAAMDSIAKAQTPIGFKPDGGDMTPTEKIAVEKFKQEQKAAAEASGKAGREAARVLKIMDQYVDPKTGKPTDRLENAVGYGEGVGSFFGRMTGGIVGNHAETRADQKELELELLEKDLLEAAKDLKPVSEDEMKQLISRRPTITDPPEVWTRFMGRVKEILGNQSNFKEAQPAQPATPSDIQNNATSRLRGLPRQ